MGGIDIILFSINQPLHRFFRQNCLAFCIFSNWIFRIWICSIIRKFLWLNMEVDNYTKTHDFFCNITVMIIPFKKSRIPLAKIYWENCSSFRGVLSTTIPNSTSYNHFLSDLKMKLIFHTSSWRSFLMKMEWTRAMSSVHITRIWVNMKENISLKNQMLERQLGGKEKIFQLEPRFLLKLLCL